MSATQRTLIAICAALLHVGVSLLFGHGLGILEHHSELMFAGADAREYRDVGNYLLGIGDGLQQHSFELRPILFPLFLVATLQVGPQWFLIAQLVLFAATIYLLADTLLWLFDSWLVLVIGLLLTLSSATLLLSPYHAMTETMSVFLVSAFVFFYTRFALGTGGSVALALAIFMLALACIVKGIFLPFLALFVVLHAQRFRALGWRRSALVLVLSLLPIATQLLISAKVTGQAGISTAGSYNFSTRFYPLVYGMAEEGIPAHYASPLAAHAKAVHPQLGAQLRYVSTHPATTLEVSWRLWQKNFDRAEGFYIQGQSDELTPLQYAVFRASMRINGVIMASHLLFVPLLAIYALLHWRQPDGHYLLVLLGFVLSIFVFSVLVYFQGDRIVLVTLPVVAVLYPAFALIALKRAPAVLRLRAG